MALECRNNPFAGSGDGSWAVDAAFANQLIGVGMSVAPALAFAKAYADAIDTYTKTNCPRPTRARSCTRKTGLLAFESRIRTAYEHRGAGARRHRVFVVSCLVNWVLIINCDDDPRPLEALPTVAPWDDVYPIYLDALRARHG
jgi:hypothetical protein